MDISKLILEEGKSFEDIVQNLIDEWVGYDIKLSPSGNAVYFRDSMIQIGMTSKVRSKKVLGEPRKTIGQTDFYFGSYRIGEISEEEMTILSGLRRDDDGRLLERVTISYRVR